MRRTLLLLLALALLAVPATARERPRLVVVVVIDQFREDYLYRFHDHFLPARAADGSPGGFRYLLDNGAWQRQCFYDTFPTETGVGHATLLTGTGPRMHGVISNTWFEPSEGRVVDVIEDSRYPRITSRHRPAAQRPDEFGVSPHRMESETLGDVLKLASPQSRVVSVALKDRAAVMMGGRRADVCLWYDRTTGNFVSSRYYLPDGNLPDWVERANGEAWADRDFERVWEPLLPPLFQEGTRPSGEVGASSLADMNQGFPHAVRFNLDRPEPAYYEILCYTPLTMEYVLRMARRALEAEAMGRDEHTDLLLVSLNSNDLLGHLLGPYSPEMQDFVLRTDRELAGLFGQLHRAGLLQSSLLVLASDHGVGPLPPPEQRLDPTRLKPQAEAALTRLLGPGPHVQDASVPEVYLAPSARRPDAVAAACRALEELPGIERAADTRSLTPEDPLFRSVHPRRSPEILLVLKPYWLATGKPDGASHGTPWSYDAHVPLVLCGPGVQPGVYRRPSSPRDLAPTLAELLWLTPPSKVTGRVLEECLSAAGRRSSAPGSP
ncbi:MAG: alkaline phosphatase family protein [Candidatus Eremiobacterota bacterium]